jgi:parallel beta-helix repeat protein
LTGNGFAQSYPGSRDGLTVEYNVFNGNNAGVLDMSCTRSCGAAGMKLAHMTGFTIRGNVSENARGRAFGLWCDMNCSAGTFVSNTVHDNGGHGIMYEISNTGIVADNLIYDNGQTGLVVAAANTKIYNNTIVNKPGPLVQAVWLFDDRRAGRDNGATWPYLNPYLDLGPNTNNDQFANNLIVSQQPIGARLLNFANVNTTPPNTSSSQYFSVLDDNLFYVLPNQSLYAWAATDAIKTPAALRTVAGRAWESATVVVQGTGDPFVSRAGGNFAYKAGSLPLTSPGRALPADVAAAIGVTGAVGRGAIP